MEHLLNSIQVKVDSRLYVNDPYNSDLGRTLIAEGTKQLNDIGVEKFTFRKLAKKASCTEAAVYRYFENKYKLLNYIISWYYGWLEYHIVFQISQEPVVENKIRKLVDLMIFPVDIDPNFEGLTKEDIHKLVIRENIKVIHTVITEEELKKQGYSQSFQNIIGRIQYILEQLHCEEGHARSLASFIFFQTQQLIFLSDQRKGFVDKGAEDLKRIVYGAVNEFLEKK